MIAVTCMLQCVCVGEADRIAVYVCRNSACHLIIRIVFDAKRIDAAPQHDAGRDAGIINEYQDRILGNIRNTDRACRP